MASPLSKRWPQLSRTLLLACVGLVIASLVASACSDSSTKSAAADPPKPSPAMSPSGDGWEVVFKDDFSDPASGWPLQDEDGGTSAYEDGAYVLRFTGPIGLGGANSEETALGTLGDQRISVDTVTEGARARDSVSLSCRRQTDSMMYLLSFSSNGYFWLFKTWPDPKGKYRTFLLASGPMGFAWNSDRGASNRLGLTCTGGQDGGAVSLTASVNGEELRTFRDSNLPYGQGPPGLSGSAAGPRGGPVYRFDNLTVEGPTQSAGTSGTTPSPGQASPPWGEGATKSYRDHGLSFQYPADWEVVPGEGPSTPTEVWRVDAKAPGGGRVSVSLDEKADGTKWTVPDILASVKAVAVPAGLKVKGPAAVRFGKNRGLGFTIVDHVGPMYTNVAFFPEGKALYSVACLFTPEQAAGIQDSCARIARSLEVVPMSM